MSGFLALLGGLYAGKELIKDATTKQVPAGQNLNRALMDYRTGKISKRELNRRLNSGYYK